MIVILYVMDSLRSDFLSCYGYEKETSPNIDQLAEEGVVFTQAFAQSTWTRASGASILTGLYPSVHGVMTLDDYFPDFLPSLPERLREQGFFTIGLTTMRNISPYFGYDRGFDEFIEVYRQDHIIERRKDVRASHMPITNSEDINEFLFPYIQKKGRQDLFVFVWSIDTHDPYFHRNSGLARFAPVNKEVIWSKDLVKMNGQNDRTRLRCLYEDMIYHNDHHIGELVSKLKELGLFGETLLIVTGDHGESFGEHGVNSHGGTPYDEVIRVPLIVKFPFSAYKGRRSDLVQHIDIAPTILSCVGVSPGAAGCGQGKSMLELLKGETEANGFVFVETQLGAHLPRWEALRTGRFKYLQASPGRFDLRRPTRNALSRLGWLLRKPRILFDLERDPGETVNLARQDRALCTRLGRSVQSVIENNRMMARSLGSRKQEKRALNEEVAKQLQALGYFE